MNYVRALFLNPTELFLLVGIYVLLWALCWSVGDALAYSDEE